jgi:hypothetical protein
MHVGAQTICRYTKQNLSVSDAMQVSVIVCIYVSNQT